MTETFIGVRDVNEETFRKFRALAIANRMKLGNALTKAMQEQLVKKENSKKDTAKNVRYLLKIKSVSFGKDSKKISKEIDKILYS